MVPAVRHSVFGKVGTMIVFRVGFEDAEILRAEFGNEFTAEQIVDLKRFHVPVLILSGGEPLVEPGLLLHLVTAGRAKYPRMLPLPAGDATVS